MNNKIIEIIKKLEDGFSKVEIANELKISLNELNGFIHEYKEYINMSHYVEDNFDDAKQISIINNFKNGDTINKIARELDMAPFQVKHIVDYLFDKLTTKKIVPIYDESVSKVEVLEDKPVVKSYNTAKNNFSKTDKINMFREYIKSFSIEDICKKYNITKMQFGALTNSFLSTYVCYTGIIKKFKKLLISERKINLLDILTDSMDLSDFSLKYYNNAGSIMDLFSESKVSYDDFFKYFAFDEETTFIYVKVLYFNNKIPEAIKLCREYLESPKFVAFYIYMITKSYINNPVAIKHLKFHYKRFKNDEIVLIQYIKYLLKINKKDIALKLCDENKDIESLVALKNKFLVDTLEEEILLEDAGEQNTIDLDEVKNDTIYKELSENKVVDYYEDDEYCNPDDSVEVKIDTLALAYGTYRYEDLMLKLVRLPEVEGRENIINKDLPAFVKSIMQLGYIMRYNKDAETFINDLIKEKDNLVKYKITERVSKELVLLDLIIEEASKYYRDRNENNTFNELDMNVFSRLFVESMNAYTRIVSDNKGLI